MPESQAEKALSILGDFRKVVQDLLAPELREIKARLDALEQRTDDRFTRVDEKLAEAAKRIDERFAEAAKRTDERFAEAAKRTDERFAEAAKRADERHAELLDAIQQQGREFRSLLNYYELRERVAVLEAERASQQSASQQRAS